MIRTNFRPLFHDGSGCFYRCRVFSRRVGKEKRPLPTRDEALALYDAKIAEMEAKFGKGLPENEPLGEPELKVLRKRDRSKS